MIQNFCGYTGLLNSLACLALAAFLYFKNPEGKINKLFALWSLSVGLWSFGYFVWLFTEQNSHALFWARFLMAGAIVIPSAYMHFALVYLNLEKSHKLLIRTCWAISAVYFILNFTPLFVAGVEPKFWFRWWPVPGILYHPYQIYFIAVVIYAHVLLFKRVGQATTEIQRKQYRLVAVGTLIAFTGGSTNFFLWYDIPIPPVLNFLVTGYVAFIAYAILHYKLWDLNVIIRKTIVFTGLFAMILGVIAVVTTVSQEFMERYYQIPTTVSTLLCVALTLVLYDPSRRLLINATDKFLFQKKENIQDMLNKLARKIITILDIDKLGQTILVELQSSLRAESGAIIVKEEDTFRILDAYGLEQKDTIIAKEDVMLQFFSSHDRILNLENVQVKEKIEKEVLARLERFNATVVAPLVIHGELIGLLILGKKRSDQEYNSEEIGYFPTIVSQIAVALSNARLYDTLKKSQISFAQQAKMAAIGTLSAGISHEIKNPLNHIKVGIAMLRMNKKHGLFDQMERYKMEEEVFKTLDILDENVTRANEVIERLSSFAKKPKEQKVESVDLNAATDMAVSFVKNELDHNSIEIVKDIPDNFPCINADLHTIEDIILNLVVNARHAIGHHGKITLKGIVENGHLDFMVKDTGKGIPKENLERIFDPFFTTKDVSRNPDKDAVKGSGLGLFIVREFIQRFGGNIEVSSEVGQGTEFHLVFPKESWAA